MAGTGVGLGRTMPYTEQTRAEALARLRQAVDGCGGFAV